MLIVSKLNVLKCSVAPVTLGFALLTGASAALAQAATSPAPIATTPVADNPGDQIIVTGSRIARPEASSSIPISIISARSITNVGQSNVSDALKDLPIAGQTLDRSSSNFINFDTGVATVSLRNLGARRTLVLINGRRSVGVPGSSELDLNNIPTDLIDHVEIATGGTSAIYGSDAVAGVVNIILKNDFTGLSLHAQNSISDKGDGRSQFYSITGGRDFGGSSGHIVANFSYNKDDAIPSVNRSFSSFDTPNKSSYAQQGLYDTTNTQTFSAANGQTYTFDRGNNVKLYQGAAVDGFLRATDRLLTTPVERFSGSILAHYDVSSAVKLYMEAMYDKTKSRGVIEPLAVDDSGNPGQSVLNFDGSAFLGIPVTNPYLPAQIANAAIANGVNYIDFRKRSNGIFDRSAVVDRNYYRGVIGVKGELGAGWKYDLFYEHSQVRDDTLSGAILLNNYGAALQATTIGGQIVCADPAARAAGCVPINIFGFNSYPASVIKFLSTYTGVGGLAPGAKAGDPVTQDYLRKSYQDVASLNITGSPFRLPGGPLGLAVGGEYHREKANEIYDPFTQAGISSAQQASNTTGKITAKEAYLEINAPLFGGHPLIHELLLEGAVRYADYSTVGGVWTYKFGGTYAPSRDIRFRAIYARAVRAPNVNELFANQSLTAITVTDPCDQNVGLGDILPGGSPKLGALPAGCSSNPAIANYLKTHPYFAYTQAQIQSAFGYLGGNPHLTAEATNTFTAGATITPLFLRGFFMSADYYSIKVLNAVASVDQQTSVTQCFAGNQQFCGSIFRDANGFITRVDSLNLNASSYHVAGVDVQADYRFKRRLLATNDTFDFNLYYNHKFKQEQTPFAGGPVTNELGTADQAPSSSQLGTGFKDQITFNLNYNSGPFGLSYRFKYLSSVTASSGLYPLPSYTYHDIQAKFDVGSQQQFEFYVGCNNLLDKQPPLVPSGNSQFPGENTVADTYDVIGRVLYAGVSAKF